MKRLTYVYGRTIQIYQNNKRTKKEIQGHCVIDYSSLIFGNRLILNTFTLK